MNNERFKVIIGGGGKNINYYKPRHKFKIAYVTNTRLMGVLGLFVYWETEDNEDYVQLFHLDYEEYGIDGYESILGGDTNEVESIKAKMMEGLGGEFKRITKRETCYLLKKCYSINLLNRDINPNGFSEYQHLIEADVKLEDCDRDKLWNKISEPMKNDNQVINYFIMRTVAVDVPGKYYLADKEIADAYNPTFNPSILIKNTITSVEEEGSKRYYNTESLVDFDKGYKLIHSRFEITDIEGKRRITNCGIINSMNISSIEATFNLKKPEYIILYDIVIELEDFLEVFNEKMHGAMQNIHSRGFLYTKFNKTNDHVMDSLYFLNSDIYSVYYITEGNQLVVGTYNKENIEAIKQGFTAEPFDDFIEYVSEYKSENQILYEFVHSNYINFLDFISAD